MIHSTGTADTVLPPARPPAIRLDALSKGFDTRDGHRLEVLSGISLEVRAQTVHALLGQSGCGKSTLLNIVAGLDRPDRGTVEIEGQSAARFGDWKAIGYLFQEDRLLPWRTALRNVALALETERLSSRERQARALEALRLVGLEDFAQAFPAELSGGMRARVALARSLVREPRILLMDEPFSKLDAQTRATMHEELIRLKRAFDMTVLFVTHDVEEAALLADTVTVLAPRPGRVKQHVDIAGAPAPREGTSPEVVETVRSLKALLVSHLPDAAAA